MTERRQLALMLAPYLFGLFALVALPALVTFGLAFTEYDLVRPPSFEGLGNFRRLVEDDVFATALKNSLVFAAIAVPLRLAGALGLALLLHRRFTGVGAYRSSTVLPTVIPDVAYGLVWLWLFNPLYGPINLLLRWHGDSPTTTAWGVQPPQWLTHPNDARAAIILMSLFTIGEGFVILLVTRQGLPSELYELAALEDATAWGIFRRITLPLMAPILLLLLARDTIFSLQWTFVPALVVTDGGPPPYATTYVPLFVYRNAFEYLQYGYAAAATLVMFLLTALIVWVQWRIVRRWRRGFVV
ncbi:MAG TPA: sugar ABC transporter permease [Gaiellaceae bacterium]|nr:sugar ABC transporter permease [Gaiellaceae bacterium]